MSLKPNTLSVIIPVFNEEETIAGILEAVASISLKGEVGKELIVINDASTDRTEDRIFDFCRRHPHEDFRYVKQEINMGKGAAIHRGIELAEGEYIVIQDADLEYDPGEYNLLLEPVLRDRADVVYGSRFMGGNPHRILFFWHTIGNRFLTFLSNIFTNLNLTDMETCYKLFRSRVIKNLELKEKRFGFEPEVTAKIARVEGIRIYEVGISYFGRTYHEGKKIDWRDGLRALHCILKYNLWDR